MSVMVSELYDALRQGGVDEATAKAAAAAVLPIDARTDLVTKADLAEFKAATKADLAELRTDLTRWTVALFVAQTAVFSAIVGLFKIFS